MRLFLKVRKSIVEANGAERQYRGPGVFNVAYGLAREWLEDPKIAVPVDDEDKPIEPLAPVEPDPPEPPQIDDDESIVENEDSDLSEEVPDGTE